MGYYKMQDELLIEEYLKHNPVKQWVSGAPVFLTACPQGARWDKHYTAIRPELLVSSANKAAETLRAKQAARKRRILEIYMSNPCEATILKIASDENITRKSLEQQLLESEKLFLGQESKVVWGYIRGATPHERRRQNELVKKREVYAAHIEGRTVPELSRIFQKSPDRIRQILKELRGLKVQQ